MNDAVLRIMMRTCSRAGFTSKLETIKGRIAMTI